MLFMVRESSRSTLVGEEKYQSATNSISVREKTENQISGPPGRDSINSRWFVQSADFQIIWSETQEERYREILSEHLNGFQTIGNFYQSPTVISAVHLEVGILLEPNISGKHSLEK